MIDRRTSPDCQAFRARKLADPHCHDAPLEAHARRCPPCAAYASGLEQFENRLHSAAVAACGDVPPGLCERILADTGTGTGTGAGAGASGAARTSWFAALLDKLGGGGTRIGLVPAMGLMAAALALGLAGLAALDTTDDANPMARRMIAHVVSEPGIFELDDEVPEHAVRQVFAQLGGRLEGSLGQVRHLGECYVDGRRVDHLLVQTPEGEASLILLPGEALADGQHSEQGFTATFIPLPRGSLGIVTRSEDEARRIRNRLQRTVRMQG